MRDLYLELIDELDGLAEDINPTPEPTREIEPEITTKKTGRKSK